MGGYLSEILAKEVPDSEKSGGSKTCPDYTKEIDRSVEICPKCVTRIEAVKDEKEEKTPILVGVTSLVFPGPDKSIMGADKEGHRFSHICSTSLNSTSLLLLPIYFFDHNVLFNNFLSSISVVQYL